jgi:hypothetical protein
MVKKLSKFKKREKKLQNIFYNKSGQEGAFSSNPVIIKNVYTRLHPNEKISLKVVNDFLKNQYTYQRHKNYYKKFNRNKIYSPAPGVWFGIDLADFSTFSEHNKGYKFLLLGCDVFSKMCYGESLKFKDKKSVLEAFKKILNRVKHRPIIVCSDLGSEFLANIFQNYLKKEKIHFVALQGTFHNAVVERQIKSIKMLLGKLWTNIGEPNWIDHVQNIITTFNNTKHSKLKIPPIKVEEWNSDIIYKRLYPSNIEKIPGKFKKGDMVRFSLILSNFSKGYEGVYSKQTFLINKGPFYPQKGVYPMYKLIDSFDKTPIPGSYYEKELQIINKTLFKHKKNSVYDVRVMETKGDMSKIHYLGWPHTHDAWVKTNSIFKNKPK